MTLSRAFRFACLLAGLAFVHASFAQFPRFPGLSKRNKDTGHAKKGSDEATSPDAKGVPVPPDSPIFQAFEHLGQQSVYRQKVTVTASDPRMQQMMEQMGFGTAETTTAGDLKQVSMHFKMPIDGQPEDFELRTVRGNGRLAKKWSSPASGRILAKADAQIAKQLAQAEEQSAKSIARNLANGPMGLVSSAVTAGSAAANAAAAARIRKQAHDFFEWTCMDAPDISSAPAEKRQPPPLTDLRLIGDQTINGMAVTGYEFFVHENGKFHGPVQIYVTKDNGLPARMAMTMADSQAGGSMQMDYYGFNQTGDFEVPACLSKHK